MNHMDGAENETSERPLFSSLLAVSEHAKPVKSLRKRFYGPVQPFRAFQQIHSVGSVVLNAAPESGVPNFRHQIWLLKTCSHPPKTPVLFFQATISSNMSSPN